MKIVSAIDSFKGSLDSLSLAKCVENGIKKVFPDANVVNISVADGGEGTLDSIALSCDLEIINLKVKNPIGEEINSSYGIFKDGKALVEMAKASGLTLVAKDKINIVNSCTYGTGQLIADALLRGSKDIMLAIGGSATNDGGVGMLSALGYKFFNSNNCEIKNPKAKDLSLISFIDSTNALPQIKNCNFTVACDVNNPFCGKTGAAYVFAKQKGASEKEIEILDNALESFSKMIFEHTNIDIKNMSGAGAAGGVGGAALAFLNAKFKSGIDFLLDLVDFDSLIKDADFIITGEGKLDSQSAFGKAPCGIAKRAKSQNKKVIAIAGMVDDGAESLHECGVDAMFSISNKIVSLEQAMSKEISSKNVERLAEELFRVIKISK